MINVLRSAFAAAVLGAVVPAFAADDAGYVDFGKFTSAPGAEFVEVNLKPGLIKFAAKIVATEEPEVAELLRNIKHVRVNVVGLDDSNKGPIRERMESIRADLEKRGWEKVVTAREGDEKGGDDVAVFLKMKDDDSIDGIVVTVLEKKGSAVFVNVVGNIKAEQLAKLGDELDIKPLRKIRIHRKAEKEV